MENKFYDGTKLLSLKDLTGQKPELYLCTTNRSGGKTTYFNSVVTRRYKKTGKKFGLLYRYNYELDDVSEKFFKDINGLFFHNDTMTSKSRMKGIYHELFLNDESCGYAISINSADQIKKNSHLLSDIDSMIFDEFQSESNHYCNDEVKKFISIHTSIARGNGKHSRYLPVYMLGNAVTLLNPYYTELGISERIRSNTNFMRGDGFVMEQGFIESASKAQLESGFNRAFKNNAYTAYSAQNVYLHDNKAFIEKPAGLSRYIATLKYQNVLYAIREYSENGIIFVDDKADSTFKQKITVTTDDHSINYVMLKRNDLFLNSMRYFFEKGAFRFKDMRCKNALLCALSY